MDPPSKRAGVLLLVFLWTGCGGGEFSEMGGDDAGGSAGTSSAGAGGSGASAGSAPSYAETVLADKPVGYWRLGESWGPTAVDASGNGRDGSYVGAALVREVDGALVNDPDTAISCPGNANCSVDMGDVFDFPGSQPFSIEIWARPSKAAGAIGGKYSYDASAYVGWALLLAEERVLFRRMGWPWASAPVALNDHSHIVGVYDGSVLHLFVNGEVRSSEDSVCELPDTDTPFRLGMTDNWDRYAGVLDEAAIYDYALSPSQVATHYRVGIGK